VRPARHGLIRQGEGDGKESPQTKVLERRREEGAKSHEGAQGRDTPFGSQWQEGQEPQAGDCHRPVRSAPRRQEGAEEAEGEEAESMRALQMAKTARETKP